MSKNTERMAGLIGALMGAGPMPAAIPDTRQTPDTVEEMVSALRDAAERYQKPCPFGPGDIIVARPDSDLTLSTPCVVLEVVPNPEPHLTSDNTSSNFGRRVDIRFATFLEGQGMVSWWGESYQFQLLDLES